METLIWSIQDRFGRFISEYSRGKLTIQSQTRRLNKDSDPSAVERQTTVNLFRVPIMEMKKPSWCLHSRIKAHHVTAPRQKLQKHRWSIRKSPKTGVYFGVERLQKEKSIVKVKQISVLVVKKINQLRTFTISEGREILRRAFSKSAGFLFTDWSELGFDRIKDNANLLGTSHLFLLCPICRNLSLLRIWVVTYTM